MFQKDVLRRDLEATLGAPKSTDFLLNAKREHGLRFLIAARPDQSPAIHCRGDGGGINVTRRRAVRPRVRYATLLEGAAQGRSGELTRCLTSHSTGADGAWMSFARLKG